MIKKVVTLSIIFRIVYSMKKLLFIFALFSANYTIAQDTLAYNVAPNNDKIIDYVYENIGKKIGEGVCAELISGASKYLKDLGISADTMYEIKYSSIKAGDIIIFDKVICSDGKEIDNHIGIIYNILSDGKIAIANQNVASKKNNTKKIIYNNKKLLVEKDSHVVISIVHPPSIIGGKITYCRL